MSSSFVKKLSECSNFSSWDKYGGDELPKVSIVICTSNAAQLIRITLDSVLSQHYPDFEVIVVDCCSEDRTLEIVKSYNSDKISVFSVTNCQRYEMVNKGLMQAEGKYINFLFPGDYYLYFETLKFMVSLALDHQLPQLVYCGTLIRDATKEVKILYRELTLDLLKRGQQPTSLESCWFRLDTLLELGKFNPNYTMRGGYEVLCRFMLQKNFRFASSSRVLTDYDLRLVSRRMVIMHFWETFKIINKYFGVLTVARWLFYQKDVSRFVRLWMRSLKIAFAGR